MNKLLNLFIGAALLLAGLLFPVSGVYAQSSRTVQGLVFDASGETLPGAAVMLVGKTKNTIGVVADINGRYSINVPAGTVKLNFSYIGMVPKDVMVGPNTKTVNVTLDSDTNLDGAVIQAGYGVIQKRADMTGSAYQLNAEDIKSLPKQNVAGMLDGIVPGLTVEAGDTYARTRYSLRIRGDASLSANCEPLWIVDDVPIYTGSTTGNSVTGMSYSVSPISFLNPEDIESITVLKDAASTSIYGADGANGVILIKTKKGSADGGNHVTASVRYGVSKVDNSTLMKLCNAEQWWSLAKEGWVNAGFDMANFPYQDNEHNSYSTTDTNWYDVYLGMGNNMEASIQVRSGDNKNGNYLSMSFFNENSTIQGNNSKRFTIRDRINYSLGKKLKIDVNLGLSYNINDIFYLGTSAYRVIPIFSPYDEDGVTPRLYNWYSRTEDEYKEVQRSFVYNDVPDREYSDNMQYGLGVSGSGMMTYKILKGLTATVLFGMDNHNSAETLYDPANTLSGITSYELNGYSRRAASTSMNWNNNNRLNFNRTFGKHQITAMAGMELTSTVSRSVYATGSGYANDSIKEISYSISSSRTGSSSASRRRSLSYLTSASYSYDGRYIVSGSFRRQGNSDFSVYQRWDNFSSAGLSWNVHKEQFWNVPFMDKLKFKVSYGNSGNSRVSTSAAYGTYTVSSGDSYGGLSGASQASAPNPTLSWEKTDIFNLGVDMTLFKGRVDLSFEGYDKYTHDMLYSGRVSSIIDNSTVTRNVGSMENLGFELTATVHPIKKEHFDWSIQFNGSANRNTIRELYQDMHTGFFDYVWVKGASKNAHWLSRWAGVDPVTGDPMWYDYDGNITYIFSYDNRVLLDEYRNKPDFQGGLVNSFRWGNFSLRVQTNYSFGGWANINHYDDGYDIIGFNTIVEELDHWREPGDVSVNPKFVYKNSTHSTLGSTRFLYSMTHIQLKNVALYYTLPKAASKWLGVRECTFSVIGDNLYFWSPEQSKDRNSYKTMAYSRGITRAVSGQVTIEF